MMVVPSKAMSRLSPLTNAPQAVVSGDIAWALSLGPLFSEGAKLTTHEGQRHLGRQAVIQRLNAGTGGMMPAAMY